MALSTTQENRKTVSLVVPIYNEEESIPVFYGEAKKVADSLPHDFEFIFVNDGSSDGSSRHLEELAQKDPSVRYIEFSRNFGKEVATTAGLHACTGHAAIVIDADLQHPVGLIPEFVRHWESGAEIVVGVRNGSKSDSGVKRLGSKVFYSVMKRISEIEHVPRSTDFRLLDRIVIDEFNRLTERDRITRGLIDWLGFRRVEIRFTADERRHGEASYSLPKLVKLFFVGMISHSFFPLRVAGYIGAFITAGAGILGIVIILDRYVFPWGLHFSGPAILATLNLFLVGIVLSCLGLIAFYISSIHNETRNRPMYVVRRTINAPMGGTSLQ